jgi:acetyltransferase-like isoleucine patch superfamily enzyme
MFTIVGGGPYCAISFDSPTFDDLQFYMDQDGYKLSRLDPNEFLLSEPDCAMQYINLVTRFPLREEICRHLDTNSLDRFSFFASYLPQSKNIAGGVFVYPGVNIYPSAQIGPDVIIHSGGWIAHNTKIGQGSFISGHVIIAGSTKLGEYCWLGINASIIDNIFIADHTTVNSRALVINDIVDENIIYNKHIIKS